MFSVQFLCNSICRHISIDSIDDEGLLVLCQGRLQLYSLDLSGSYITNKWYESCTDVYAQPLSFHNYCFNQASNVVLHAFMSTFYLSTIYNKLNKFLNVKYMRKGS